MEKYNLTFPQRNIWLVENFYDSKRINIISGSLVINKDFDLHKAEKTVNEFARLNDGMRLRLVLEEGTPKQYVAEYKYFETDKIDVSGKTEKEIENIKQEYIDKEIDIIDKPLFSYLLIDRGNGQGEIFFKAHHLICDGWSGSKIATGLAETYDKILEGKEEFESYPSYVEYIAKEQEYTKSEKFKADEEFWKEYLKDFTEPVGIKESSNNDLTAKRYSVKLNKKLNTLILDYCKENKVSPYSVFMTAVAIYLERITEKKDIIIGTPILNRGNFSEKQMQGMFVSTMPVRFKIDEGETFKDLCVKNARESMSLFRHQRFPFEITSENLKKQAGITDNMFKVMVSYQNARAKFEKENTYHMTWTFTNAIQDQLEVHIVDLNDDGILEIDYDYVNELFEDKEIEYIAKRIETIIEDGIVNNKTIETIEIMPKEEKDLILNVFNNTKRDYPKDKTVIDLFEEQVEKTPDNIALVFENEELTYRELNNRANGLANYLRERGVNENEFVAITIDKSIELMVAILAVLKCGACYVPIDVDYSTDRKEYILKDANCKFNLISSNYEELADVENVNVFGINEQQQENLNRNKEYTWDSLVYVMYTSGTTGRPKGAMITNRNIVRLVINTNYIEFKKDDRIIQTGATVFDASTFEYWGAFLNGLPLCLIKKVELLDPYALEKFIDKNKITIMWLTAPLFNQMAEININLFKNIRVLLAGGDVLSVKHVKMLKDKYPNIIVVNGYGPTENTTFSNCHIVDKIYEKRIPIGAPIANSTGYVVDSKNRLLPIYVQGELIVGGDGVSRGYLNNNELTQAKYMEDIFVPGGRMYRTGDIVCWCKEGVIDFFGRKDNQVKIRGFRIELDEIKNCIEKFGEINQCVVIVKTYEANQKELFAYFVSERTENIEDLYSHMKEHLATFMLPKAVMQIENIPLNTNGKVDTKKLPEITVVNNITKTELTEKQKEIADVIRNQIGISILDAKASLFDYGVDSLNIIKLAVAFGNAYKINISASDIINNATIEGIEILINISEKVNETTIVKEDEVILNTAQKGIFSNYMANPNSLRYNIPFEMKIEKPIDINRLKSAIDETINNSDILFFNVDIVNGEVVGKINKKEYETQVIKATDDEYKRIKSNFIKPADLLNDTLFDVKIIEIDKFVNVLFDFNHIIFDGHSMNLFLNNIVNLYVGKQPIINNYINNVAASKNNYDKSKEIVLNKFKDNQFNTSLCNEKATTSEQGKTIKIKLSKEQSEKIKHISRKYSFTPNIVFNTAYILGIAKLINKADLTIGVSTLGRNTQEQLNSIGMYVKTMPIRYNVPNIKLVEFIKNCQNEIFDYISNDAYDYFDMIKDLKVERKSGRNPLYNIVYAYQTKAKMLFEIEGSKIEIEGLDTGTSKFELNLQVIDDGYEPEFIFEYNPYLLSEETIINLIDIMKYIFESIDENIEQNVYEVISVTKLEGQKSKQKVNKTRKVNKKITEEEEKILNIYSKVLNSDIDIDDDFFTCGGDSLLAIKLVSEFVNNDYSVTYADVFEYSSPRLMAKKIINNQTNEKIDAGVEKYNYDEIHELLRNQQPSKLTCKENIGNIFLTGATGFLGAHILDNYLKTQNGIAYCLVRKANGVPGEERLKEKLRFFFGEDIIKLFGKRIIVVEGDVIYSNLMEDNVIPKEIISNIDVVINSAAHVKHFGNKELFYKINVKGVKNLVDFCENNNLKLLHISTLSVSGNLIESGQLEQTEIKQGTHFSEKDLYINQNLNNIYVYTKFIAERYILEEIIKNNLKAKIVRVGNLTGRTTDGKFQPNVEDNAFANRIKSILEIEKIPTNIENLYLEFTPIDITADAIIKICKNSSEQIIYHLFNHKHLPMKKSYQLLKNMKYKLEWISKEEMRDLIKSMLESSTEQEKAYGIVQDLNSNAELEYTSTTIVDSEITCNILKKQDFMWSDITDEYFYNYIKYLVNIGFLKEGDK